VSADLRRNADDLEGVKMTGNLLADLAPDASAEVVTPLLSLPGLRIERIVSLGQASPPGFWYDQPQGEWVLLWSGAAGLRFEDEGEDRVLGAGDYLWIAPHRRHRVSWTTARTVDVGHVDRMIRLMICSLKLDPRPEKG